MKNIFTSADILLPYGCPCNEGWAAWSVIACDQFTSEPEYWEECAQISCGKASAYNFVLPEAYLATEKEDAHKAVIAESMKNAASVLTYSIDNTLVYLERTLPDGTVRYGIVGKIDLEEYDYNKGSASAVRATEATVLERIPPRCAIRAEADVELPHVMLLIDDVKKNIIEKIGDIIKRQKDRAQCSDDSHRHRDPFSVYLHLNILSLNHINIYFHPTFI